MNLGIGQNEPTSIYNNQTKETEQSFHSKAVKETDRHSSASIEEESKRKENLCENDVYIFNKNRINVIVSGTRKQKSFYCHL